MARKVTSPTIFTFDEASSPGCASPVLPKRRKLDIANMTLALGLRGSHSSVSSDLDSPVRGLLTPERRYMEDSFNDSSNLSSAGESPSPGRRETKKRFKKDELWRAIQPAYQYLMDEEIIETCKSTESDLSWDDDDLTINTKVSFAEFMQQYKELTDWLTQIQVVTQRQGMTSLSEKYLNQSYHEEMLQSSPRKKLFNDYAKQLIRRFPNMKEEIHTRLAHLNNQWLALENAICPPDGTDQATMLRDLESDLNGLRSWLQTVENTLLPLCVRQSWDLKVLEDKLKGHQALQGDIESHSKIVSAVLKLCERLHPDNDEKSPDNSEQETLRNIAINLERRWHAIWLQSLEWQCRLEEAINRIKNPSPFSGSSPTWGNFQFSRSGPFSISPDHVHGIDDSDLADSSTDAFDDEVDDEVDGDLSINDTIPFSEDEYEKFAVDVDCQTEAIDYKEYPISREVVCEQELADEHSSNTVYILEDEWSGLKMWHSTDSPDEAAVSAACSSVNDVEDASKHNTTEEEDEAGPCKLESQDVGYGSESLSNDEPDPGIKISDEQEVETSGLPTETVCLASSEVQTQEVIFRRKISPFSASDGTLTSNSGSLPTVQTDTTWRYSMTSAYDTSSNCSDHPNQDVAGDHSCRPPSLVIPECVSGDDAPSPEFRNICASPGEKFYTVTALDEDSVSERTAKDTLAEEITEPNISTVTATEKDVNDCYSSRLHKGPATTKNRVDILWTEIEHLGSDSESHKHSKLLPNLESSDLDVRSLYTQEWTESTNKWSRSFSTLVQSTESNSAAFLSRQPLHHTHVASSSKDPITRLVSQAESLINDEDLVSTQRPRWRDAKQKRRRKPRTLFLDSITSTDGSARTDSTESGDASCECTTESDADYSSALSDPEINTNSILSSPEICVQDTTGSTLDNSSRTVIQVSSPETENVRLRHANKRKHERPKSVTEMYERSNRLDFSPFSISEGAIYHSSPVSVQDEDIGQAISFKGLVSPPSPSQKCSTLPRTQKPKFRKLKRSRSESEQLFGSYTGLLSVPSPQPFSRERSCSTDRIPSNYSSSERTMNASFSAENLNAPSEIREQRVWESCEAEKQEYDFSTLDYAAGNLSEETDENLNSTIESFSETAWDNFQEPYATISEDGNEEKLDDSHLQWEASTFSSNLEFDDDFILPPRDRKKMSVSKSPSGYLADTSRVEDSDSDLEDLQHIVEESKKQIQVAEMVLKLDKKDAMDTGIYLQPQKYGDVLATCKTNIRCLQTICETLEESDGGMCLGDDDFRMFQETIKQWSEHHDLAMQRQEQSKQLACIYKDMVAVRRALDDLTNLMKTHEFPDHFSLEHVIKSLQDHKMDLCQQKVKLDMMTENITTFSIVNNDIQTNQFQTEIGHLTDQWSSVSEHFGARFSELQSLLICWYDYNETNKELSYFLNKERQLLQCLEMTFNIMQFTKEQKLEVVRDLKGMLQDFQIYEKKLLSMRRLSGEILAICDHDKQLEIRAEVAMAGNELCELRKHCQNLMMKCLDEGKDSVIDLGLDDDTDSGIAIVGPRRGARSVTTIEMDHLDAGSGDAETVPCPVNAAASQLALYDVERLAGAAPKMSTYSLTKSILRMALPFQLAILVLYGILCILDQDVPSGGISFTPTLRYVQGPPPI